MSKYRTNLQAMRKRAGFKSAREFAEFAGVNVKTYTNHEQGTVLMSLLQAWEYADLLHCTLDELAGRMSPDTLTDEERIVVNCMRDTDARGRRAIMRNAVGESGVEEQSETSSRRAV